MIAPQIIPLRQLPPRKIASRIIAPWMIASKYIPLEIAPEENYLLDDLTST